MASVNKVIIVGNLGRDPENRYLASGEQVTNITIATTENWKDKSGEKKENTEWHRIVFYGRLAEIAGKYLKKGSQVYVEGKLRSGKYTDKNGIERHTTDIIATTMQMLGSRNEPSGTKPAQTGYGKRKEGFSPPPSLADMHDDIPF